MGLPDTHPSMRLRHPSTAKAPGRSLARRGFRDRNPAVSGDLPDSGLGGSRPRWALSECAVIRAEHSKWAENIGKRWGTRVGLALDKAFAIIDRPDLRGNRSEERRVGKECRSRW